MPYRNRVAPTGEFHAVPCRGSLMGNRGILQDGGGRILKTHAHRNWVTCALHYKGRKQSVMVPRHYTQLFFLDEATALAAVHRPCATRRRARYRSFVAAWREVHGAPGNGRSVPETIDRALHAARIDRKRKKVTFRAQPGDLPNGTIFADGHGPVLLRDGVFLRWSFEGYRAFDTALPEEADVLTPAPLVALYTAGRMPGMAD